MIKKVSLTASVLICLSFFFLRNIHADEISDMKTQLKAMQQAMDEQARQMKIMQGKIDKMEVDRLAAGQTVSAPETPPPSSVPLKAYWKNGLYLQSPDENFDMKIGGRLMLDGAVMREDAAVKDAFGDLNADVEVRRLRLYVSGDIHKDYIYKLQLDFAGGNAALRDAYIGMQNVPYLGTIRVGQYTEPISLENLTSSNYITFMERDLPQEALVPHRNDGISFLSNLFNERATLSAGAFLNADDYGRVTSPNVNLTGRFTALPWYEENGAKLLHLGVAYSYRSAKEARYHGNPEAHLVPDFVDTGTIAVDHVNIIGLESALIYGPFSLQGEFIENFVDETEGPSNTHFEGAYIQASYFLTGEHRNYEKDIAQFSGVKLLKNFSIKDRTFGAFEIAARYSYTDLDDNDIKGGILNNTTLGINWYLNPNMRVMINYVHAHPNGKGNADIGMMRFQLNF